MSLALPVHRLVLLEGKKRALVSALAGAVSALAMPPYDLWPLLFVAFPVLVLFLDGVPSGRAGVRSAAVIGYWFGFGYFLAGLWWIGAAFFVPGDNYQWLMPFAVLGLPAFLALFPAFGCVIARLLWSNGAGRLFALALGLGVSEVLRGRVLTGFPWNEYGYALANNTFIGQAASVIGVEGLTLVAILVFAAPATLFDEGSRLWRPTAMALAALVVLAVFGGVRLSMNPTQFTDARVRIMQPNIPQDDKFRASAKDSIMARYLALSDLQTSPDNQGMQDVDLLVWPESAFPFILSRTPDVLAQIGALLPEGAVLLTGAARIEYSGENPDRAVRPDFFNSIHALVDDGSIIATYDKVHLVPGGEFLPFQDFLETLGLRQLTRLPGGFTAGESPRNITLPSGLKIGPLICYEAIFPTGTMDPEERPDVLVNVTNDGWFGNTPGPHQHFAQARIRAVEQGLPLVRAANTGISGIVDPWGRVLAHQPLSEDGALDTRLPLPDVPTLYYLYGIYLQSGLYIAVLALAGLAYRRV